MKKIITLLSFVFLAALTFAQTTEYETGNTTGDGWTGWSTPVVTNCSGSVNGADHYAFTGSNGASFTIETYRQFSINSNDIDIYLDVLGQNATVEVEYSTDNVSYSNVQTMNMGAGYAINSMIVPTYDAGGISSFYLKIKVSGTFGSPSSLNLYYMKIDAVLNSGNNNAIAPTTTQNIEEGQNGTALVVTEMPSPAGSREWKWSTTSGSGYQSFSPTETGGTYTPNFATAGTYYVICESDFSGDVQTSNEVQINVTAPAKINELELGSSVIYTHGLLQIITTMQDYNISIYDINGKLITSKMNLKEFDLSAFQSGIYLVNVMDKEGQVKTFKISH